MLYDILEVVFAMFDSVLATIFLLKFNGYNIKEKLVFLSLAPVLVIVMMLNNSSFDIISIAISILISFIFMVASSFNRTTKLRCFWSGVLFYRMLMLSNSIANGVFQTLMNIRIVALMERTEVYVTICIISKSILLVTVKTYTYMKKRLEPKRECANILNLLSTSLFNILLFVIMMQIRNIESSFAITLMMVGLFVSGLIHYYMYAKLSSKARLELEYELLKQKNDSEKRLYENRKEAFENVTRINHDIKNHLMYVAYNIRILKYEKAVCYIESIVKQLNEQSGDMVLSNDTLNFIINYKTDEAKRSGISVTAHIEDVQDCIVEDFDLCSLLGNILDNAIEGEKSEIEKHILIEIYNFSGYQVYSVKNRVDSSVLEHNRELSSNKRDKKRHGYGMKQILDIINNYQGHVDIYEQDKYFNVKVLIPREI